MNEQDQPLMESEQRREAEGIKGTEGTALERYTLEPQRVTVSQTMAWFSGGWRLFTQAPGVWVINTILLMLLLFVLGRIPLLGFFAQHILMPVFVGGMLLACRALEDGQEIEVAHLFAGFKSNTGNLVLLGLLYSVGLVAVVLVAFMPLFLLIGSSIFALAGGNATHTALAVTLKATFVDGKGLIALIMSGLIFLVLLIPLWMAYWFAPALVVFHNVSPIAAMKASFRASCLNAGPLFVWSVVVAILAIVAMIPMLLGLLILVPMIFAMNYLAYKDLFLQKS